jgi:DNA-binding transcriptional regulator YhcF (GntR family)
MRQLPLLSAATRGRLFTMSVRIMSEVFERSKTQGNARLVLLALADSCSDEGVCFPSLKTIAGKANISEETTRKFLHAFEKIGLVEAEERFSPVGRRTSNTYKINLNKVGDDELTKDVIYLAIPKSKHRTSDGMNQFTPSPSNLVHTTHPLNQFIPSIMNHHKEPKIEPSQQTVLKSIDLISIKPKTKRKPKLVDDAFITELKRLNPDKDVDKEAQMARTWILAKPERQFTQQFLAGWINRSTNTIKPEKLCSI